jgi:hypothetical protein
MTRNGSLPSSTADHAERSSARLLTPVELADLPGRDRCEKCGRRSALGGRQFDLPVATVRRG